MDKLYQTVESQQVNQTTLRNQTFSRSTNTTLLAQNNHSHTPSLSMITNHPLQYNYLTQDKPFSIGLELHLLKNQIDRASQFLHNNRIQ